MPYNRNRAVDFGSIPACAGEPFLRGRTHLVERSIPACAGEPVARSIPQIQTKVYPRVCGGTTLVKLKHFLPRLGLSPRVRGNRLRTPTDQSLRSGSIPACAGEPHYHEF